MRGQCSLSVSYRSALQVSAELVAQKVLPVIAKLKQLEKVVLADIDYIDESTRKKKGSPAVLHVRK